MVNDQSEELEAHEKPHGPELGALAVVERDGPYPGPQLGHRQAGLTAEVVLGRHVVLVDLDPQQGELRDGQREGELLLPRRRPVVLYRPRPLHQAVGRHSSYPHLQYPARQPAKDSSLQEREREERDGEKQRTRLTEEWVDFFCTHPCIEIGWRVGVKVRRLEVLAPTVAHVHFDLFQERSFKDEGARWNGSLCIGEAAGHLSPSGSS